MTEFRTERLPLAIYLHADKRLRFLRCEQIGDRQVAFVFADPNEQGTEVEYDFDSGAAIPAIAIFASQKFIRQKMADTLGNRFNRAHNGESRHEYKQR